MRFFLLLLLSLFASFASGIVLVLFACSRFHVLWFFTIAEQLRSVVSIGILLCACVVISGTWKTSIRSSTQANTYLRFIQKKITPANKYYDSYRKLKKWMPLRTHAKRFSQTAGSNRQIPTQSRRFTRLLYGCELPTLNWYVDATLLCMQPYRRPTDNAEHIFVSHISSIIFWLNRKLPHGKISHW